jgi:hypothetical protein
MTNTTPEKSPKRNDRDTTPQRGWNLMDALGVRRIGASARRVFGRDRDQRRKAAAQEKFRQQAMLEVGFGGRAPSSTQRR